MLCCYTVSCSFAHTRTSCSAWRVAGYLGNLSTKYLLVTAGTPDHNISGSQTAESSSLPVILSLKSGKYTYCSSFFS